MKDMINNALVLLQFDTIIRPLNYRGLIFSSFKISSGGHKQKEKQIIMDNLSNILIAAGISALLYLTDN
jgi:hypothetical protein